MIRTAQYARERDIPYLGLCLGLQMMIIEFARNVAGIEDADSTEFDRYASEPVIALMEEQKGVTEKGATMRLGEYDCVLAPRSKAYEAYAVSGLGEESEDGEINIRERHRHRYEYNNAYRDRLEGLGLLSSGFNPGWSLVEIAEVADHPFMVGSQFHPEFRSRPEKPHPLFDLFVKYARHYRPEGTQQQLFAGAASAAG